MNNRISILVACCCVTLCGAEEITPNLNSIFISSNSYIQNPYANSPSGGKTKINNSDSESDGVWETLFSDGTYNINSGLTGGFGSKANGVGGNTYAYGSSAFAQTGRLAGFSIGAGATVMNPLFAKKLNGLNINNDLFVPSNQQIAITQSFIDYQYSNIVDANIGYISINNSPWLSPAYSNNMLSIPATYQGALVNMYPGSGWLMTALAFNGIQTSGENGFTGETFYNQKYGLTPLSNNASSNGTIAFGANYLTADNTYNLRLWGYQFDNFGSMLYGDTSIVVPLTTQVSLNFAAQAGLDNSFGANTAYSGNPYYSGINSQYAGAQAGIGIDWFSLVIAANTVYGPSSSLGNGAIVAPYSTNLGTDPLYAEGWMTNLVNGGMTGNIYKISSSLNFLDNTLSITPNYVTFYGNNSYENNTQEAYITTTYSPLQIKGLSFFAVFAYEWQQDPQPSIAQSPNSWTSSLVTTYLW
ncbi:MAG: hypothetical protein QG673_1280 [Pseudomonadota bacterium]|nr:hypothetical protein [Pseudomonadota bacterium]